jgi:hypothetical protein
MLEQARKRGEPPAYSRGGRTFLLALHPLPGDDRAMIDLAQRLGCDDIERLHEVTHVEPVGAAGAGALLLGQPDLFLGDGGELVERGNRAGVDRNQGIGRIGHGPILAGNEHVINRIITC